MGNALEAVTTKIDTHRLETPGGMAGGTGMQGTRPSMEDSHILVRLPSLPDHVFLGLFDGHGGSTAAKFAVRRIVPILEQTDEYNNYKSGRNIEDLKNAIRRTYFSLDKELREFQRRDYKDSGCTAVCVIVTPDTIVCANAGDSRCILASDGMTIPLSDDHKPDTALERQRIEGAGGEVRKSRVDGELAVSRGFGDFRYKRNPNFPPSQQKVTCDPDICVRERNSKDEAIILACDGVWDVMMSDMVSTQIRDICSDGEKDMALVAEELIDYALHCGSMDNISAIVMSFPGLVIGEGGGVEARRLNREDQQSEEMDYAVESEHDFMMRKMKEAVLEEDES